MFGYKKKYEKLLRDFRYLEEDTEVKAKTITELNITIKKLNSEKEVLYGSKGGLTKQNNKLIKLNTDLRLRNEQLEEENKNLHELNDKLLSNRYKVRKIRGTKATKEDIKTMGIRRGVINTKAKNILKRKNESEEKVNVKS